MRKLNKKGFTLIEILAVVIIMTILLAVVVPAVSKYIINSKKNNYESTLRNMVSTVNNEVTSGHNENYMFDEENNYLVVPLVCVELEKGNNKKSPFNDYVLAYSFIIVEGTNIGYSYKVQALDKSGYGTKLIKPEEIKIEELDSNDFSYITKEKDSDEYGFQLKTYSTPKTPYVFTCDALTNDVEVPVQPDDSNSKLLVDRIKTDNTAQSDDKINFGAISSDTNGKGLYYTNQNTEENKTTYYFRGNVENNYVKFGTHTKNACMYNGREVVHIDDYTGFDIIIPEMTESECKQYPVCVTANGEYVVGWVEESGASDEYSFCINNLGGEMNEDYATYERIQADLWWRIVRINEDGSIRLITQESIGKSKYNESADDNAYVGYMYGTPGSSTYDLTHTNTNSSTIKTFLEDWYEDNLLSNYDDKISYDAGFCVDRHKAGEELGYGQNHTVYAFFNGVGRQLSCPDSERDLFTTSASTVGNKKLKYPIGLITGPETIYAGHYVEENKDTYLINGTNFWTMTPGLFGENKTYGDVAYIAAARSNGIIGSGKVANLSEWVRPVINLKSNVQLSTDLPEGCTKLDGTEACPYIIDTNS